MLHKRLVSALTKIGATVNQSGYRFIATKEGGSTITWHKSECEDSVSCVTKRHPDTDAMFDNFMDSYHHTIKGAVEAICEQPYKSYKNVK